MYQVTILPNQFAGPTVYAHPVVFTVRSLTAARRLVREKTGAVQVSRFPEKGRLLVWRHRCGQAFQVEVRRLN
jgi:hypothetical protein